MTIPIAALIIAFVLGSAGGFGLAQIGSEDAGAVVALLAGWGLFGAYVLWAVMLFVGGTTPGKRVLRMWVVTEQGDLATFGRMLLREWIGKWISAFLLLGYLWIILDDENQGWHDKLASTYVVSR